MVEIKAWLLGRIFGWQSDDDKEQESASTWAGSVSLINNQQTISQPEKETKDWFQSYEDWKKNPQKITDDAQKIYDEQKKQEDKTLLQKISDIRSLKNKDIYQSEWDKVVIDEKWEPIKKKNWLFWVWAKYTFAPIKTVYTLVSEYAQKKSDDVVYWAAWISKDEQEKIEEYKSQKNIYENTKAPEYTLQQNKELLMEDSWDITLNQDRDAALKNYNSITTPYLSTETTLSDLEKQIQELEIKKNSTTDEGEKAKIDELIDQNKAKQIIEISRYTQWEDFAKQIDAKTSKDVLNNIKMALWVNATDQQIIDMFTKSMWKKLDEAKKLWNDLYQIDLKFNIRSDDNAVTLTPKAITKTFNDKWVILTSEEQDQMFPERQNMQTMITNSNWDVEQKNKLKVRFHYVNEIQENTFNKLTKWSVSYEDSKDYFIQVSQSQESKNLINTILNDPKVNAFYDEKWNFDSVWFSNYISSTKERNEYYMLLDSIVAEKNSDRKRKDAEESKTILWWALKKTSARFNDTFLKADDEYYSVYKTWKEKWNQETWGRTAEEIKQRAYEIWSESAREQSQEMLLWFKREDISYAQDPWQRTKDSINTLYNMAVGNRAETFTVAVAATLPFTDFAKWVEWTVAWIKFIKNLQNPILKTAFRVWSSIAWETAEWAIMWTMLDSMWETEAQPTWLLLDMGIWALKATNIIKQWIQANKLKNEINVMSQWLNLSNKEDLSKLNDNFFQNWYWIILNQEWKKISDFIENWKINYSDLYNTLERWKIRIASSLNPSEVAYQWILKNEVDNWKITQRWIDQLFEKAELKYWSSFDDVIKNYTNNWIVDKFAVVSRFLSDTFSSAEKLSKVKWLQWLSDIMKATWITKPIEDQYEKLTSLLKNARKWASDDQLKLLDKQQSIINEMRSEAILMAYRFSNDSWPEIFANLQKKMNEVNKQLASTKIPWLRVSTDIKDIYELPDDIIKNINNPKKIAEIVFGDEIKYQKFWIKTYDVPSYIENNKKHLIKQLWAKWYKRLENIINTINDLNWWKLKLLEIPKEIRQTISWITWFTTFVKDWESTNMVIWSFWWLVEIISWWKKIANSENAEYIKVMCHEIWHNILLSLKDNVRNSLSKYVLKFIWKWDLSNESSLKKTLSNLLQNASKERIDFLSKNSKSSWFIEEVSADMLSDAIQWSIFWMKWDVEDIWGSIMKQVMWWNVPTIITKSNNPFNVIWSTVISAIESLYKWLKTVRDFDDMKWMMYFIAANILEWNRKRIDIWKQSQKIINKWYFNKQVLTRTIEVMNVKTEWEARKFVESKLKEWESYELIFLSQDNVKLNYIAYITKQKTPDIQITKESIKQQELFYMYKTEWWLISTLREWVNSFDVSKIYAENTVRDMLFDNEITSEYLWSIISLSYDNVWSVKRILKELWEDTIQSKKLFEALEFARTKNGLAIRNLQKFWKDWEIDLIKKVDWKTFYETIANVSSRITKQWFVEFAWQDLIKFMNISDKNAYNKIVSWYVNFFIENYESSVVSNVKWIFDSMWIKWNSFWEQYLSFVNRVENHIINSWEIWWLTKEIASDAAKDIVSRLVVGAQWYISMLNDIAKTPNIDINWLINEIAFWITKKNNIYTNNSYYDDIYNSIFKWFIDRWTSEIKADKYSDMIKKWYLDLWSKEFSWYKQSKDFFNFLSARSAEYIQLSLKDSWVSKINMDAWMFASFINKITFWNSRYQTVLDNKFMEKWIFEFIDNWLLKDATTRSEIVWVYQDALSKNKTNILWKISEDEYRSLETYINNMEKNWLSNDDAIFFLKDNEKRMNTFWKWLSIDWFFRDTLNNDQIKEIWKNKKDWIILWLYRDTKTKNFVENVVKMDSPNVEDAILATNYYIQEHINLVDEIKTFWFDDVSEKIVNNDLYSLFFDIEKWWAKLTTKQIDLYRKNKFLLDFQNSKNDEKHNFLSWLIWAITNPITVAEVDKQLWSIMESSMKDMNKTFFIWDNNIWRFLKNRWYDWKYISKTSFMEILQKELEDHIRKWWLTYDSFIDDVANVYAKKYYFAWMKSYNWSTMWWYNDIVDSYVELLWKNHSKEWYYKITTEKIINNRWKKETIVKTNELKSLLIDIWKANWRKLFAWLREKSVEADRLLWLWWNWLWMSISDINKLKDKSIVYHPKMFNNFLFKSFASTDSVFWALDWIMKTFRKIEKASATAMYISFYNILWAGWSAMTQQEMSNAIHYFWKKVSEIWVEDTTYVNEVMDIVDTMIPSDLAKMDLFKNRPEMVDVIQMSKWTNKMSWFFDQLLNMSSSLTWADKSIERNIKKYALASAFIEKWYKWDSTIEFVNKIQKTIENYNLKWYNEYIDIQKLIKYSDDSSMKILQKKLTGVVDEWKMTLEESMKIYNEIDTYRKWLSEFRDIATNARIKTSTFFQMNNNPEMVQNFIWGWAWAANMRFLNRASRKAGDYWFKILNAIKSGDDSALLQIVTQIVWEWLYAGKIYTYFNNASNDWIDVRQFMWSMFLPYVVLNMVTLNAFEWLLNMTEYSDYEKKAWIWKVALDKLFELVYWFKQQFQWRVAAAPLYWIWQIYKQTNWLKVLSESEDWESVYKFKLWSNVTRVLKEMVWDILQWRIWKFNTQTTDWLYSNFLSDDNKNYMLNFLVNKVVTNDLIWEKELSQAFYGNIWNNEKSPWSINLEILWFKRNQRFAARELDKFYKQEWLSQLNWWPYVLNILDIINNQSDISSITKQMLSEWKDISIINNLIEENMKQTRWDEWLATGEWMKLADLWYKPFQIMVSSALMNSTEWDKALVSAWQWVTTKEKEEFERSIISLTEQIQKEIEAMPESLVKAAAYDPTLITKKLVSGKWRFWEQQIFWATLNALSNMNKWLIKDSYKKLYWKQRYKENSKQPRFKEMVEKENAKYQRQLVWENYNTVLMWNQTMSITLADLYINTNKNSPLKNQLTNYSILWTTFNLSLIEKNIASQWLSSMWVNNSFAQQNSRLRNYVNWLSPEEKEKALPNVFALKNSQLDYIDKYMSPIKAMQAKIWIWVSDVNNIIDIAKDPELLDKASSWIKDYIDRVTVSQPLTDEKMMDVIRDEIFKTPWKWSKKRWNISFNLWKMKDDLNKLSWFKSDFYRNILKEEPLDNIQYKLSWSTITPIKLWDLEAKKVQAQYQFIKIKAPESEKTPDIIVQVVKTSKPSWKYTSKSIKWANVYTVKTTKWKKW